MICRKFWLIPIVLLALHAVAVADKKVAVCHIPAGNPAKRQTISVGEAAVSAHLAHGDQVGACAADCPSSCDDGNLCTSDSCDANGDCVHSPVTCDDGVVQPGEQCDDGNTNPFDGCDQCIFVDTTPD